MPTGHGTVSLGGAIATAAVAAVGWTLAYFLTGWREDRTKRLQLELEHASEQIREFYAPLAALTDQLDSTADVYDRVIEGKSEEERDALSGLFYARFFLPIHEQINEILKKKVHLLEGPTPPKSFTYYFQHYATEKAYWNLRGRERTYPMLSSRLTPLSSIGTSGKIITQFCSDMKTLCKSCGSDDGFSIF